MILKIGYLILLMGLSGCWGKKSWQGTYLPIGTLTDEKDTVYSPVFKSYGECKSWVQAKLSNEYDEGSCGQGCEFEGQVDMSKCEVVVRSWSIPISPDSPTFDNYKE